VKISLKKLGRVPIPKGVFLDLSAAYLCSDCRAIGDGARKCPRCGSGSIVGLFRFIPDHQDTLRLRTPESTGNRAPVRFMRPAQPLALVVGKE
jgi:ribosomal protein S27AE